MKKKLVVFALAAILATGAAFADHPEGWGIGVAGGWNGDWAGGGVPGLALSLKAPVVPIYWGIGAGFNSNSFSVGVTGDYYLLDKTIIPGSGLNWFLGLGGWLRYYNYSSTHYDVKSTYSSFAFGARLPIGISWQPIDWLEVFFDVAPSLGVAFEKDGKYTWKNIEYTYHKGGVKFPAGGWPIELGIRFWL